MATPKRPSADNRPPASITNVCLYDAISELTLEKVLQIASTIPPKPPEFFDHATDDYDDGEDDDCA